uniref:C-type lectin domain-containing protein n=1 Tax=Cyprinodon variegatus TaxID=28743 RepID=A0A3Q2DTZ0_CYPVA
SKIMFCLIFAPLGDKAGKTDFSPVKETRTLCFKAALFLGLLSFLLLAVVVTVSVLCKCSPQHDNLTCPVGWRKFGCRCYLLSSWKNTWEQSKYQCSRNGADLMFLKELGDQLKFWIGLQYTTPEKGWKWVDGSSLTNSHFRTQGCAALNSFRLWSRSWSKETCSMMLHWVCEKQASPSGLLQ